MIAMQYSFTLPADYDMSIVDRRIAERGHLLDGFPKLRLKAYLTARAADALPAGAENLYAPFYVWDDSAGMNEFLCGPGFESVSRSFGRPSVRLWSIWQAHLSAELGRAAFATREVLAIPQHAPLGELRGREAERAAADFAEGGALAAVSGFDPAGWTLVRFRLWDTAPDVPAPGVQAYKVGHLSLPAPAGPLGVTRPSHPR